MPTQRRRLADAKELVPNHTGGVYAIRVKGHLDDDWLDWFEGMTLQRMKNQETGLEFTELRGMFADQPALHGAISKIRDLNLTLISVIQLDLPDPEDQKSRPRGR